MGPDPIRLVFLQEEKMWTQRHRGARAHTHTRRERRSCEDPMRKQPSESQGERLQQKPNC